MTNLRTERSEEVRHVGFRATEGSDGYTLEGYAAVFNEWTDIRDAMGVYKEQIAPGAFKRSLGIRTPVIQFDHGTHPLIGSIPLGALNVVREDRNGLFVRARIAENWMMEPVRHAIRDGGIKGMSFRFRVVDDAWGTDDEGNDTRTVKEVELLELGPVVFPAYEKTSLALRSLVGALDEETRAELVRELGTPAEQTGDVDNEVDDVVTDETERSDSDETNSTSPVAGEPADDDSPAEPPVASHEPRTRIAEALARFRHTTERTPDVDQ